jgi:hypothetical protein
MSEIDYEELIRSPLDDLESREPSPWGPLLGGLLVGLIAGYLVMTLFGTGEESSGTSGVPDETVVTTTTAVESAAPEYPAGYAEFAPGLAARPEEIFVEEGMVTVAFTSVVARGNDPATTPWPRGGAWLLETASGTTLSSSRVVFGASSPGAFAVQFPAANLGPVEFRRIRMLERWDTEQYTGSVSVPFPGQPFELAEPLSIPVNQGTSLLVPRLELGRFRGEADWRSSGTDMGVVVDVTAVLLDEAGEEVGSYAVPTSIVAPGNEGTLDFNWQRSFPDDQEGAVDVSLDYTVGVIEATATDAGFSLADVPVVP